MKSIVVNSLFLLLSKNGLKLKSIRPFIKTSDDDSFEFELECGCFERFCISGVESVLLEHGNIIEGIESRIKEIRDRHESHIHSRSIS